MVNKDKLGQMKNKNVFQLSRNKFGQMKIQQMAFMLMAVFILFVLIGIIFLSAKLSNIKKTATDLEEKNAFLLVSKIANSPEFSCGNSFGNQKSDCVDLDKVMALKKNINDYKNFWGVSNIEIRKIPNNNVTCTDGNYPSCDTIKLIDKGISGVYISNFVSICYKEKIENKIINKCEMGKILVSYEAIQ